jgi:hypothetical protein
VFFLRTLPAREFAICAAIAVGVVIVVVGPFAWWTPDFTTLVLVTRPARASAMWEVARNAYNSVSVNNGLVLFHLSGLRAALQLGVLVAGAVIVALRPPSAVARFLFLMGATLLLAVALNSQVLRYYYEPAFLLIAVGAGLGGLVPGNPSYSKYASATAA